jgi:hypothetical protein
LHDGFSFDSGLIARHNLPFPIGWRGESKRTIRFGNVAPWCDSIVSIHSDDCRSVSIAGVQILNPSSVSSLKSFYAESFKQCIQAVKAYVWGWRRMIAFPDSRFPGGERFKFGTAHSEYCFRFFTLAGESGFNGRDWRGAETGSGFGDGHGMGWGGIYFAEGVGRNSKQGPETEAET